MMKIKDKIGVKGKVVCTLRNVHTGEKRVVEYYNLNPAVGRNAIATRLAGGGSDGDLAISYGAVGTDATAPASGDTTLGTSLKRKAVTLISSSGSSVNVRVYFSSGEGNGSLKEFGLFGGGSATATQDTGTLFQRVAINITKSSSETLTIESSININEG